MGRAAIWRRFSVGSSFIHATHPSAVFKSMISGWLVRVILASGFVVCSMSRNIDERGASVKHANHEGVPVAVYTFDQREACKRDREHRQSVNPNAHYYVLDKPLNPKAAS